MGAMKGVKRRLAARGVKVHLESSGVKAILDASYEPSFGARPVERYLEGAVVTTLSRMLISRADKWDDCAHRRRRQQRRLRHRKSRCEETPQRQPAVSGRARCRLRGRSSSRTGTRH